MLANYPHRYPIINDFRKHLEESGVSYSTQKGYLSDITKFLNWLKLNANLQPSDLSLFALGKHLNHETARNYKADISTQINSNKTLNRQLSTLRHFARFLMDSRGIDFDFTHQISNIAPREITKTIKLEPIQNPVRGNLLKEFKGSLLRNDSSKNTIKNYISDVRQFLLWLEDNIDIKDVKLEILKAYTEGFKLRATEATAKRKVASLKRFFQWAKEVEIIKEDPYYINSIARDVVPEPSKEPEPQITPPSPSVPMPVIPKNSKSNRYIYLGILGCFLMLSTFLLITKSALRVSKPEPQVLSSSTQKPDSGPDLYRDGVLTLSSSDSKIKAIGKLLIAGSSIVIATEKGSGGDINVAPDGQGTVNIFTSNTDGDSFHVDNANIEEGALISASAGNELDTYYLLKLESGSPIVTRFSVDSKGNVQVSGALDLQGDLDIEEGKSDTANISKTLEKNENTLGAVLSLLLDETNGIGSSESTLVLKRLGGNKNATALLVDDGNARFDGQIQLGSFSSNPEASGEGSVIYNSIDKEAYYWNGTSWVPVHSSSNSNWREISNILYPNNTNNDLAVGDPSSPVFLVDHSGNAVFSDTLKVDAQNAFVGVGTNSPITKFNVVGKALNTPLVVFDNEGDGDILGAQSKGVTKFRVASTGSVFLRLDGAPSTSSLCHRGAAGEEEIVDCIPNGAADYMEMYPTTNYDNNIYPEKGDIVTTSELYTTTRNGESISKLVKSNKSYQDNVIGIISDIKSATDFNSVGYNINAEDHPMPVALVGRVQVRIDPNSPEINAGDFITTSEVPGRGMKATKAGYVVGKALDNWSPTSNKDSVLVLVGNSYFTPELLREPQMSNQVSDTIKDITDNLGGSKLLSPVVEEDALTLKNQEGVKVVKIDTQDNSKLESNLETKNIDELYADKIYTTDIVAKNGDKVVSYEDILKTLGQIEADQKELSDKFLPSTIGSASSDKELEQLGLVSANNIYVTERGTFQNISVVDSVAVGNDFIINKILDELTGKTLTTINTIDTPLMVQSLALQPIEMMNKRFTIDTDGNVKLSGNLSVKGNIDTTSLSTKKVIIASDTANSNQSPATSNTIENNATAGHSTLPANTPNITIKNDKVNDNSLIYLSPSSPTDNNVLYVKEKGDGYFSVGFIDSIGKEVDFDWWVIDLD